MTGYWGAHVDGQDCACKPRVAYRELPAPDIGMFSPVKVQEILVHQGPPDTEVGEPQFLPPIEYAKKIGMSYDPERREYTTESFDGTGCVHKWVPVEFQKSGVPVFDKGYRCFWCQHMTRGTCDCLYCQRERAE